MAGLNMPSLSISQGVVPFVGLPIDTIKETYGTLLNKEKQVHEASGVLQDYIGSHNDLGNSELKEIIGTEAKKMSDFVDETLFSQDAAFKTQDVTSIARKIQNHKGLQAAKQAEADYNSVSQNNANVKGWEPEFRSAATQYGLDYMLEVGYDEKNNSVKNNRVYQGIALKDAPEMDKMFSDVLKMFEADKIDVESIEKFYGLFDKNSSALQEMLGLYENSPYFVKFRDAIETKDPNQVKAAVFQMINNNPEIREYIATRGKLEGYLVNKQLDQLVQMNPNMTFDQMNNIMTSQVQQQLYSIYEEEDIISIALSKKGIKRGDYNKMSDEMKESVIDQGMNMYISKMLTANKVESFKDLSERIIPILTEARIKEGYGNLYGNVVGYTKQTRGKDIINNRLFDKEQEDGNGIVFGTVGTAREITGKDFKNNVAGYNTQLKEKEIMLENKIKTDFDSTSEGININNNLKKAIADKDTVEIERQTELHKQQREKYEEDIKGLQKEVDYIRTKKQEYTQNIYDRLALEKDINPDVIMSTSMLDKERDVITPLKKINANSTKVNEMVFDLASVVGEGEGAVQDLENAKLIYNYIVDNNLISAEDAGKLRSRIQLPGDAVTRQVQKDNSELNSIARYIIDYKKGLEKKLDENPLKIKYSIYSISGDKAIETVFEQVKSDFRGGTGGQVVHSTKYNNIDISSNEFLDNVVNKASSVEVKLANSLDHPDKLLFHTIYYKEDGSRLWDGFVAHSNEGLSSLGLSAVSKMVRSSKELQQNPTLMREALEVESALKGTTVASRKVYGKGDNASKGTLGESIKLINPNAKNSENVVYITPNLSIKFHVKNGNTEATLFIDNEPLRLTTIFDAKDEKNKFKGKEMFNSPQAVLPILHDVLQFYGI